MAVFVFPPVDKEKKNKYARENLQPLQSLPTRYFQAHRVAGPRTHRKTGYTWHGTQLDRLSLARNAAGPAILGTERSWTGYTWHGTQLEQLYLARNAAWRNGTQLGTERSWPRKERGVQCKPAASHESFLKAFLKATERALGGARELPGRTFSPSLHASQTATR